MTWKKTKQSKAPSVYTPSKKLSERMIENSSNWEVYVRDTVQNMQATREAERALTDLITKVQELKASPEAKVFWADRLEALMKVLGIHSQLRDQVLLANYDYSQLYERYTSLAEKCKELEDKLSKYERL